MVVIEVFRTDVQQADHATMLVSAITAVFKHYKVNFDLEDVDRILRIESEAASIDAYAVIMLLRDFGYAAEVLPDEVSVENEVRLPPSVLEYFFLMQ